MGLGPDRLRYNRKMMCELRVWIGNRGSQYFRDVSDAQHATALSSAATEAESAGFENGGRIAQQLNAEHARCFWAIPEILSARIFALSAVLMFSIWFFSWPRVLIPPFFESRPSKVELHRDESALDAMFCLLVKASG